MADRLWERAHEDVCVQVPGECPDLVVWEHSRRVAQLADAIASVPEATGRGVDPIALTAAGLYHDAGWVIQVRAGALAHRDLLLKPTPDVLRELAADWLLTQLEGIVPPASLELAARAIRCCNDRQTDLIEAQILAEAENLDDIGPQTICAMLRKQRAEGKTLDDLLSAWQRQEEYHYWQARIKEGFRFPSVRAVAERRWRALRRFMNDLRVSIQLEDLVEIKGRSSAKPRPAPPAR